MRTWDRTALVAASLLFSLVAYGQSGPKIAPSLSSGSRPLADVVDQVDRSVVRVIASFTAQVRTQDGTIQTIPWTSTGTGFILDAQARIVTAGHIVSLEMNQAALEQQLPAKQLLLVPGSFRAVNVGGCSATFKHRERRTW